jgi:hypothetical protein
VAAPSIEDVSANVTVGVDTHKHSHVARAKDRLGRHLGQLEIETDPRATPASWRGRKASGLSSPLVVRAPAATALA